MAWSDAARAAAAEARRRKTAGQDWRRRPRELNLGPPIKHSDFIAQGKTEAEWDAYAKKRNKLSRERDQAKLIAGWRGSGANGADIHNVLRSRGITVPNTAFGTALDHSDTRVSALHVSGRGMKRGEANKLHKWVSENMQRLFPARKRK